MITDIGAFKTELKKYLQRQLFDKKGFVVHLDGTIMSFVLVKLLKEFLFDTKIVITSFSENKQVMQRLSSFIKQENLFCEVFDLSNMGNLSTYNVCGTSLEKEIIYKNQITTALLNSVASEGYVILSNLSYSQWITNFPHKSYKDKNKIYCLASFYYSEIQELAKSFNIDSEIKPSHYFYYDFFDEDYLGFTYSSLEQLMRAGKIETHEDHRMAEIIDINFDKFEVFKILRPNSFVR